MNAAHDLLQQARAAGYILTPKDGGLINIRPRPTDALREAVKAHKAELLALLSSASANDTPSPLGGEAEQPCENLRQTLAKTSPAALAQTLPRDARQRAYLGRPLLVSAHDLLTVQRRLLAHLTRCRECCADLHLYCREGMRDGAGMDDLLTEFHDGEARRERFMDAVIRSRISGTATGFRMLEAAGDGQPARPPGPAELAWLAHAGRCLFCLPGRGLHCSEGKTLRAAALLEGVQ